MNQNSVQLQKGFCYTPACTGLRRIFNVLGCILAIGNSAFDFLYPIKSPYYTKLLYMVTIVALIFRMVVNFGVAQFLYTTWVWNYRPGLSAIGEAKYREEEAEEADYETAH